MTMKTSAFVCLVLGFVAACNGPAAAPKTPEGAADAKVEDFGPVIVSHHAAVDDVTRDAVRVLRASYEVAPSETPGIVTTVWADHDATRWPGAQTRVVVEITNDRLIVRVQCRHASDSCARTVPEGLALVGAAESIADQIHGGRGADAILAKMRDFKDEVCACADRVCVENVEKSMMEWAMKNMDKMKNMKPTKAQDEAADRIEDAMDECKERVSGESSVPSPEEPDELVPLPPGGTGSPQCDLYVATFDKVVEKCADKMGPALDAMVQSRNAQVEAFAQWNQLDKASRKAATDAAKDGCQAAADALRQSATAMGCAL